MASTFAGLSITKRGLNAAQIGLSTTSNNMANIDTTGYSQQVLTQVSIGPAAVYSSNLVGSGVDVTSVDRVRSSELDQKYWGENSSASKVDATSSYLEQIEDIFGSTDTSNITTTLNTFYEALSTLSSASTDDVSSDRKTVLEDAENLCNTLNETSDELTQLRSDVNTDVYTAVSQINSYASQIASLNSQISAANANGASANDLEDSRDLLVDKLSSVVGVSVTEDESGNYDIAVNGVNLVTGSKTNQLECYTVTDSSSSEYGMYGIRWADSGNAFNAGTSGSLSGYLTIRDGDSADSKGILYYQNQLDSFARTFAEAFNEGVTEDDGTTYSGHADGYGLDGTTGIRFFTCDDESSSDFESGGTTTAARYANITAANISVSSDVQNDTDKIAASSTSEDDSSNTDVLNDLVDICEKADISGNCTTTGLYNVMVADVASNSAYAQEDYARKSARATYINNCRSSVSGVSSDQETVNMTVYTQAYAASAEMTSAWKTVYEDTIDMVDE